MKQFYFVLALLLSSITFSQSFDFTPKGKKGEIHEYIKFTVCYSEEHEQAYWVAYILTQTELELPKRDRISRFIKDKNISTGSATHDDYTNTGYDRGHLSRAEFNKVSAEAYRESFRMSNISPQIGLNFNRTGGDWYNLEELEKDFAFGLDEIFSVSGPIFEENLEVVGKNNFVTVPGYFYKAILSPDKKHAIAFILRHDNIDLNSLWSAAVSIDELEGRTGIDFFAKLDNKVEKVIESELDLDYWKDIAKKGKDEKAN